MGRHDGPAPEDWVVCDPDSPWAIRLWRGFAPYHHLSTHPRSHLLAIPWTERDAWTKAIQSIGIIRATWPALGAMADPADIRPALDRARWELAVLLARRFAVTRATSELAAAANGLGDRTRLHTEIADRRTELASFHESLNDQIARRLQALHRLSEVSGEHAREERRVDQVRKALSRSRWAETPTRIGPDPVAEVADRTAAVLTAYRELSVTLAP